MCVEILKSWQGLCCFFYFFFILGVFISSILIWTTTGGEENALIHCILSNCLLGWGLGGTYLDSGLLPGCSPYYSASMQWLSPCTPTLPCKNSFSSSAGKTPCPFTPDYCVHLLHRQQVCFPPAWLQKGWNSSDLMIFLLSITLSLLPPHQSTQLVLCVFYSWDEVVKCRIMFQSYTGMLWPFVRVPRLNWIDWVIICQVMLSRK